MQKKIGISANIPPGFQNGIAKRHKNITAKNGNIVFFSSHIIDIVERLCDRIAIIRSGEIIATDTVQNIIDSGVTLEEYYLQNINGTTDLSSLKQDQDKDVPEGAGV